MAMKNLALVVMTPFAALGAAWAFAALLDVAFPIGGGRHQAPHVHCTVN